MKNRIILLVLTCLFSVSCFAQFSKTHYIPPVSNSGNMPVGEQYLYISSPSLTPISFTITQIGGVTVNGTVSRDVPFVHNIGTGSDTQALISDSDVRVVKSNKGFIVEANDLVYASIRLKSDDNAQAGSIVSKGLAALGTKFRVGAFVNTSVPSVSSRHYTFATMMATENNTTVTFGGLKPGVILADGTPEVGGSVSSVVLNAGQCYAIGVQCDVNTANIDGLVGASIRSDKPIAVNCGSFVGSSGTTGNIDIGMDQIVSVERLKSDKDPITNIEYSEYIFIKGNGLDVVERPMIVAEENGTEVFLNGSATATTTLNAGQYLALTGADFSVNKNLYIKTSKKAFAFQGIGGTGNQANQNMHFLPPLSCQTPQSINNIPLVNSIGADTSFTGTVNIITETGGILTFIINGINYTLATLPAGITVTGPFVVTGNANYVTYILTGFTGNVSAFSTKQLYLSYFGSNAFATYGGFYSGFTFKPEITFQPLAAGASTNCIPNVDLQVSTLTSFNQFQWYFNTVPSYTGATLMTGATNANYTPIPTTTAGGYGPGYYFVKATLTVCSISYNSDIIPVSECPKNLDNDIANDNVDIDLENDAISNCTESFGDLPINLANLAAGNFSVATYSNTFTGATTTAGPGLPLGTVTGNAAGNIICEIPAGKDSEVAYKITFANPTSVSLQYVATGAAAADLINDKASFIVKSPVNTTVTVLNPTNQLLIDTNYDGIYESGITQFSSFEIRFRVNSATPLAAGTGTFSFRSHLTTSLEIIHKNQLDTAPNRATFNIIATCVPRDYDGDGIPDQKDIDTDNDGIIDNKEFMSQNYIAPLGVDANKNGMDDAYDVTAITASDKDNDGVKDYLDLDSDNDGIYDLVESGSTAVDTMPLDGEVDGLPASFGTNGLSNSLETAVDNGIPNYTIRNTDAMVFDDYIDSDADEDLCSDVVEAGFLDQNNDFYLGNAPLSVNTKGVVTGAGGYTAPNADYITAGNISITTQPANISTCELQGTATFTVTSSVVTGYQWQVSTNGGTSYTDLVNNATYSNVTTATLSVANPTAAMAGYKYRVYLTRTGNACGMYSTAATLTTWALPILVPITTLKQCDDDTDGISVINLTQKNSFISANSAVETFTYFTSQTAAQSGAPLFQPIPNPTTYTNTTATTQIWVRVVNANGCFSVSRLDVTVAATAINPNTFRKYRTKCDDYISPTQNDYDGIAEFDFSAVTADVTALLPPPASNYIIKYYKNLADAQSELNEILNISAYRNVVPNTQDVYVRVDSTLNNDCIGFGRVTLTVEKLPVFNTVGTNNLLRKCDDNNDGTLTVDFNTTNLEAQILNGQNPANKVFTYFDGVTNAAITNATIIPSFNVINTRTVKVRITNSLLSTNASDGPCWTEKIITFLVDELPQNFANLVPSNLLVKCDDETTNPLAQDGKVSFDTTTFNATIMGTQAATMVLSYTYRDTTGATVTAPSLPNPFITNTQTVSVKVSNPLNTSCDIIKPLNFVVNPLPRINLIGAEEVVCKNIPTKTVTLNGGIVDGTSPLLYTYVWTFNDGTTTITLPQTTPTITVNTGGTYSVTVTNNKGCSAAPRTIKVYASDIASIQNIIVNDLTDINSVEVIVTGTGTYEYALDDPTKYQTSNFFDNVAIGFHTVYIQDVYKLPGCGWISKDISIVGGPRFFTPNGDGVNDFWNLKGVSKQFNYKSIVYIYNRFGTLIKQITPGTQGWDGTFEGVPASSDDYWYVVELADGRNIKGHFSLKR